MIRAVMAMAVAIAVPSRDGAVPLQATNRALRGPAVVVLWASWCVACRAEVARLPRLAADAAPLPIRTLAIDPPARALALLRERGEPIDNAYADERPPRVVLDAWGGPGSALPIAVAIDGEGRVCGRKLGLLGTNQLRQWAATCSR